MQPLLQCKSNKYYIFWMCIFSLLCPVCNVHACPTLQYFSTLSHKRVFSEKKAIERQLCVLLFSANFVWNIFRYKKNWTRYDKKCVLVVVLSGRNFCSSLMKLIFRLIFEKIFKYQISWKSVRWNPSYAVQTDGQTDRHDEANSHFS